MTGVTGLTYDDKLGLPTNSILGDHNRHGYSRGGAGGPASISNLHVPSVGPLLTSPHTSEEYIYAADI